MTPAEIARAICCPDGCRRPDECCWEGSIREARAVHALLCRRWREWPKQAGPMTQMVTVGGRDE